MSSDVVRFESNERVDLADLLAAVDDTLRANARDWGTNFLADPTGDRSWILSGFETDAPLVTQVRVTKGRAILGQREGGRTFFGALASEGDATRIIDIGSFSAGTYGVYVRFELLDGESSSRAFWDPTGDGAEITQTIPTRRLANWSIRVELSTPGAEWLRVASVVIDATPEVTGVTDLRDLYFEGTVNDTYESGWSSEGGGVADDRNSDRQQYGVTDLHTFTQAMRQCLEDIKGRGLRRWWEKGIGGINIGFDDDPVEDRVAVGDANCYFHHPFPGVSSVPTLLFDLNDSLRFERSSNQWEFIIGGTQEAYITGAGLIVPKGGVFGFNSAPIDDVVAVGDVNFGLDGGTIATPIIWFAANDYLQFTRSSNHWDFVIGGSSAVVIEEDTPGSPTVRALDPTATSDDGKNIFFAGGPSGSDADKDGGDVVLSGGDATGTGSSLVSLRAATRGAAGTGARVAEQYITADGLNERNLFSKKLLINIPPGDTNPAVLITSDTHYSIQLLHTASDKAPLSMGIMSEPTGLNAVGDIYIASGGVLKICTNAGTPGTWVTVGSQT